MASAAVVAPPGDSNGNAKKRNSPEPDDLLTDPSDSDSDSSDSSDDDEVTVGAGLTPQPKSSAKPKSKAAKAKAPAKPRPKAKAPAKPKRAFAAAAAAPPPVRQKPPSRKKTRTASPAESANGSTPNAEHEDPAWTAAQILRTESRHMNDVGLMYLADRIVDGAGAKGRVLVVSSVNIGAILSRWYAGNLNLEKVDIFKMLGVTREAVATAEAIVAVVHGPCTTEELIACEAYGEPRTNDHWSALCYFKGLSDMYHYDSAGAMNQNRALEIAGLLIKAGVIDKDVRVQGRVMVPEFFPTQTTSWECGYFVLLAIKIISEKSPAHCITARDVDHDYGLHVQHMHRGPSGLFTGMLLRLLSESMYT